MKKLASRFSSASVIQKHTSQGKSFSELGINMANQIPDTDVAVGPLTRNKLKKLLDKGDIDQRAVDKFYDGGKGFYQCVYNYCVEWLKLDCPFLKNCQFTDFNKRNEMSFSNIEQIIPFSSNITSKIDEFPELYNEIEGPFLDYQAMSENDIPSSTWKAAEIGDEKFYRIDVIWGYLRAKLPLLSDIAICVLVVPHSNVGEEKIFSKLEKNSRLEKKNRFSITLPTGWFT